MFLQKSYFPDSLRKKMNAEVSSSLLLNQDRLADSRGGRFPHDKEYPSKIRFHKWSPGAVQR